jgi:D-alanine transfer protein
MPHLFSGLIASGFVAAVLVTAEMTAVHLEHTTIRASAPELFPLKNQGLAFQRAAARAPGVLPFYGSSELTALLVPERAHVFFRTAPTGFQVSPVGAGGTNTLVMLQKVGALGSDLRGKKVVFSLSPGWFVKPGPGWMEGYRGNFSPMAASEMVFGSALDFDLKRDIALRMLKCPSTLEGNPFLEFAVKRLASGRWIDRVVFWALWPLGKVHTAILELQDHFAAFRYIRHKIGSAPPQLPDTPDWSKLMASASETRSPDADKLTSALNEEGALSHDVAFQNDVNEAAGWADFELLLRTLERVHARPLLLSMPIAGDFYDRQGISRSARENYYAKLRALVQRYHFPLVEFETHDEDPAFLYLHKSHLTAKGWIYYDRALDDFFQGRSPGS